MSTLSNLNIPPIEHSQSNLQNTDPVLATNKSGGKHPSIERIKKGHAIWRSASEKNNSNEVSKLSQRSSYLNVLS